MGVMWAGIIIALFIALLVVVTIKDYLTAQGERPAKRRPYTLCSDVAYEAKYYSPLIAKDKLDELNAARWKD